MTKPNPTVNSQSNVSNQYLAFCNIDRYVSQIHHMIRSVGVTYSSDKSQLEKDLLDVFPEYSIMRAVLEKCMQLRQMVGSFFDKEKQIIINSVSLLQQIQSYLMPVNYYQQKNTFVADLKLKIGSLNQLIKKLPLASLDLGFEVPQPNKKSGLLTEQSIQVNLQLENLYQENSELKQKILQYEKRVEFIENKLSQLYRQSKQEDNRRQHKKRLVDRICDNVFSEQFMIQANFDIRNEFYSLKVENQKLRCQIAKFRDLMAQMKKKQQVQKKYLRGVILDLENDSISRYPNNLVMSIKQLQHKIKNLEHQRLKDQEVINNLQNKIQSLSFADNLKRFQKKNSPSIQYGLSTKDGQSYQATPQKPNQKNIFEKGIKSSKSTLTLKEECQSPRYSGDRQPGLRKFCSQAAFQLNGRNHGNQEELKTSGFFLQPEEYSYFSHKTNKIKQQKIIRREKDYRTPSTFW